MRALECLTVAVIACAASAAPAEIYVGNIVLEPGQEVSPPALGGSSPTGSAQVTFNSETGFVEIVGAYSGLSSDITGSHLHGLAGSGFNAGILISLTNSGGTSGSFSGSATLSSATLIRGLLDGQTYINVHTQNNSAGEIRGQVFFQIPSAYPALVAQPPDQASTYYSDADGAAEQADDFEFNQDVSIVSLRWWGGYLGANTPPTGSDKFTLRIYDDAGGKPATNPVVIYDLSNAVRANTGETILGSDEYVYRATVSFPLTLKADTRYWLAIINDTTTDTDDDWAWSSSSVGNNVRAERYPLIGQWMSKTVDRAIELGGDVIGNTCPSDFDSDGLTTGADLAFLLANWGPCGPPMPLVVPTEPVRIHLLLNLADDATSVTPTQR